MKPNLHAMIMALTVLFITSCASAQKPTKENITKAMQTTWEKAASTLQPKVTITINDIKLGASEKSNYAQQLDGIPKGATVTSAKIDFTENTFYTNDTRKVRRITTGLVYKDKFGEWAVMNAGTIYP